MSKRDISFYIVDILIACNKIERYTTQFENAEEFKWSELEWDATLRELEIVGEATKHLLDTGLLEQKRYRRIVDFRNVIVHGYFGIDEEDVFDVIKEKLPQYCKELKSVVKDTQIDISEALLFAKEENRKNEALSLFLDSIA